MLTVKYKFRIKLSSAKLWFVHLGSVLKSYSTLLLGNISTRANAQHHWKYNTFHKQNNVGIFPAPKRTGRTYLINEIRQIHQKARWCFGFETFFFLLIIHLSWIDRTTVFISCSWLSDTSNFSFPGFFYLTFFSQTGVKASLTTTQRKECLLSVPVWHCLL